MRHIPNLFTLLNLVFGCIAIILVLQTGQSIVMLNDQQGTYDPVFPEKMAWGALFIFLAAIIDFLDGFLARLLNAPSDLGKQLDSLSDVVSFGVAPGIILYQLLRLGYATSEGGLDIWFVALLPAFLFTCAAAWRLAKFNISHDQTNSFLGVPTPAAALVVASFPLIIWNEYFNLQSYFINVWLLYAVIVILSYLMISRHRFMALKFKDYSLQTNRLKYILVAIGLVSVIFLKWAAVPVIFIAYVALSLLGKEREPISNHPTEELDVTV
ncbi:MAG: CDP-alcohol phosphatidyltransferase family protein [Candidatus Dadabacteria bacterium]